MKPNATDTINIVRIATKCADALNDFDELESLYINKQSKYIRFEVKKNFIPTGVYLEAFSSALLTNMVNANSEAQKNVQKVFYDTSQKIYILNQECTHLMLLYAKTKSILNDINEMKYSDGRIQKLKQICFNFTRAVEKNYASILKFKDSNGYEVNKLIEIMDLAGKSIKYK